MGMASGALPLAPAASRGASPAPTTARVARHEQPRAAPPPSAALGDYDQFKAALPGYGSRGGVSSNAFASKGTNQNTGNMLTDRRTSRVLTPPGGRSSIVFG